MPDAVMDEPPMDPWLEEQARLPPILARLERITPTYGSFWPKDGHIGARVGDKMEEKSKRQLHQISFSGVRNHDVVPRKRTRATRHSKSLQALPKQDMHIHRSSSSRPPKKSFSLPHIPPPPKTFNEMFKEAKKAVVRKKTEGRWSPTAVMERLDAMRNEYREKQPELEMIIRPTKRIEVRLPALQHELPDIDAHRKARHAAEHTQVSSQVKAAPLKHTDSSGKSQQGKNSRRKRTDSDSPSSPAMTLDAASLEEADSTPLAPVQASGGRQEKKRGAVLVGMSLPKDLSKLPSRPVGAEVALNETGMSFQSAASQGTQDGEEEEGPPVQQVEDSSTHHLHQRFEHAWCNCDDDYGYTKEDAFAFFKVFSRSCREGDTEVEKEELGFMLEFLGFLLDDAEATTRFADEITHCATLDFNELLKFLRKFTEFEQGSWQQTFKKYDSDGSGSISTDELKLVLQDLGYWPMRQMLEEALDAVDSDKSGQIDFEEFKTLMVNWRKMEGLSKDEFAEMREVFARFDTDKDGELTQEEFHRCKKYLGIKSDAKADVSDPAKAKNHPIGWKRFLTELRHIRETEVKEYRVLFDAEDKDGSGELDYSELVNVIQRFGFEPLKKRLDECIVEVDEDGTGSLNFEEFVHIMWLYCRTEGFTSAELTQLKNAFKRFDKDGSGEISVLELGELLRWEGYHPTLAEVQKIVDQYDADGSGDIGLREYYKFMRKLREAEITKHKKLFTKHDDDGSGSISTSEVAGVLAELGFEVSMDIVVEAVKSADADGSGELDWDEFVGLMETYRQLEVRAKRRRCGFDDDQVEDFQEQFDSYDKDGSDDLDNVELMHLLADLNLAPRSEFEQMHLLNVVEQCRQFAEETEGRTTFWVFLRLLRTLEDDQDRGSLAVEREAANKANFKLEEVTEFRSIFNHWYDKLTELGPGCGTAPNGIKAFTADGIARMLRSVGCSMPHPSDYERLEQVCSECDYDGNGYVDFPDFLLLWRRLLDENFRELRDKTQSYASY